MFVLGVLVGRGSAPITFDIAALEKELAALRQKDAQEKQEAVEKAVEGKGEEKIFTFWGGLRSDKPDVEIEIPPHPAQPLSEDALLPVPEKVSPPHKTRVSLMAKTAGAASVKPMPEKPVPAPVATAKPPASASPKPGAGTGLPAAATQAKPASPSPPPAAIPDTGTLTIQVAATKDADAAERIIANLRKEGYPAYLSRIVVPGKGLWFRIRVGSYQTREQAADDIARLIQAKQTPMLVTQ